MNYFVIDGISSADYNVVISGESTWGAPERDIEEIEVPGRNGSLYVDKHRFKNVSYSYSCALLDSWRKDFPAFKAKMMAHSAGYFKLEDTYRPDEYVMARIANISDISYDDLIQTGTFTLNIERKPQRFIKTRDKIVIASATQILNPTEFASAPVIRIYGNGKLQIGNYSVTVSNNSNYIDFDAELMEAYVGDQSANDKIVAGDDFFIDPGLQSVALNGITKIEIDPRWWTV